MLSRLVEEDFGKRNETSRWFKADVHDSLVVDKERNVFYWNSRDLSGDVYAYLVNVRGWSSQKAKEYVENNYQNFPFLKRVESVVTYPKLVNTFFVNGLNQRDYFYSRGLLDKTIDHFLLGYFDGWATIPIFEDGVFKNFQLRRDNPKQIKAYYRGVGQLLFNVDILKYVSEVFMVEGTIDALILIQNGLPAIAPCSGVLQPKYFHRFYKIKRINILFDNDRAGYEEAVKTAKMLGEERCYIYLFQDFGEKYDPVDFFRDGNTLDNLLKLVYNSSKKVYQLDYLQKGKG